jgi:hypothetical protein
MKDHTKGCLGIVAVLTFAASAVITFFAVWSGLMHGHGWSFMKAGTATIGSSLIPGLWAWLGVSGAQTAWSWSPVAAWLACLPSQGFWVLWLVLGLREMRRP